MLNIGEKVPNFEVVDHNGEVHSLKKYEGQKLVVFFYPRASTPGCTIEVKNLRDGYQDLTDKGYSLLGVSQDSIKRQKNFAEKHCLPFPLLADTEKEIVEGFGVYGLKKFMGKEFLGIKRTTFLIDENGVVSHRIDKVKTKDHVNQILELLG
ncbi:MAG: thioredoxin-dependent thiol peroxidase [Flavobacteriaceae bacterium]|nr:thioredoxin-dependent thiol peroxidase [Flavobacteriaceae bacterium]